MKKFLFFLIVWFLFLGTGFAQWSNAPAAPPSPGSDPLKNQPSWYITWTDITNWNDASGSFTNAVSTDQNNTYDGGTTQYMDGVVGTNIIADLFKVTGGIGSQGEMTWNADEETVNLVLDGSTLQLGQEVHAHVKNDESFTITNGKPVMFSGTDGASGNLKVKLMVSDGSMPAKYFLGVATEDITVGDSGKVTTWGKVREIDTSAWSEGAELWCDPDVAGGFTTNQPLSPSLDLNAAVVINSHAVNGTIFVRALTGFYLSELHDVAIVSPVDGDLLTYNTTTGVWTNENVLATVAFLDEANVFTEDQMISNATPLLTIRTVDDTVTGTIRFSHPSSYWDLSSLSNLDFGFSANGNLQFSLREGSAMLPRYHIYMQEDMSIGLSALSGLYFRDEAIDVVEVTNANFRVWGDIIFSGGMTGNGSSLSGVMHDLSDDASPTLGSSLIVIDNQFIGLGPTAGRLEFDDEAQDEISIMDAFVGIGTSSPDNALDVSGIMKVSNNDTDDYLTIQPFTDGNTYYNAYGIDAGEGGHIFRVNDAADSAMIIDKNSQVGINTVTATAPLTVNGESHMNGDMTFSNINTVVSGGAGGYMVYRATDDLYFDCDSENDSANGIYFRANGASTYLMTLLDTGYGGKGVVDPKSAWHVIDAAARCFEMANTFTDDANKTGVFLGSQFDNGAEPEAYVLMMSSSPNVGTNALYLGGGYSVHNTATEIGFYTAANAATRTGTRRMTIDGSGNVGIGSSLPSYRLHVWSANSLASVATSYDDLVVEGDNSVGITIAGGTNTTSGLRFNTEASGQFGDMVLDYNPLLSLGTWGMNTTTGELRFMVANNSEVMRIDSAGNVGIGESSPDALLEMASSEPVLHIDAGANANIHLDKGAANRQANLFFSITGSGKWYMGLADSDYYGSGSDFFIGEAVNSARFWIDYSTKNVGIGTTSPDEKLEVNGTILADSVCGQLYLDGTQEQNLTATYAAITNMTSINIENFTATVADASGSQLTNALAGTYMANFQISFGGGSAETYEAAVFVDGVEQVNVEAQRKTSNNDIGSMSGCGIIDLTAGQSIDLRVKSLDAAADFDPEKASLTLHRLGR